MLGPGQITSSARTLTDQRRAGAFRRTLAGWFGIVVLRLLEEMRSGVISRPGLGSRADAEIARASAVLAAPQFVGRHAHFSRELSGPSFRTSPCHGSTYADPVIPVDTSRLVAVPGVHAGVAKPSAPAHGSFLVVEPRACWPWAPWSFLSRHRWAAARGISADQAVERLPRRFLRLSWAAAFLPCPPPTNQHAPSRVQPPPGPTVFHLDGRPLVIDGELTHVRSAAATGVRRPC